MEFDRMLFSENEIKQIVKRIAGEIENDYGGGDILFVGVLKGSFIFLADLVRRINTRCSVDFISAGSYGQGTVSSGTVVLRKDIDTDIKGRNVIIVEDILDSGRTLGYIKDTLIKREPKTLKICVLLDKPARRTIDISADYVGAEVPDEFIVGYGLDYSEKYRQLPYLAILSGDAVE